MAVQAVVPFPHRWLVAPTVVVNQGDGSPVAQAGRTQATTWRYDNAEVGTGIVWECDGKISYQSQNFISPWHGSFYNAIDAGFIRMFFDYRGIEGLEKSVFLYRTAPQRYEGYDYLARRIVMTCLDCWIWQGYCWRRVPELN